MRADCARIAQPAPPLKEEVGEEKGRGDSSPAEPVPSSPVPPAVSIPAQKHESGSDLAELRRKAEPVPELARAPESKWRHFVRVWGQDWVAAAVERVTAKAGCEVLENPWGYLCGVLKGYREEGGPPVPEDPEVRRARIRAAVEQAFGPIQPSQYGGPIS